ncbi:MAG: UbiA family prenyltransferase [Vicingaceae bacterium]
MKALYFLSYSNIFIALCAASLCSFCHLITYNNFPSWVLVGFVFSSTLFAYNFHRRIGLIYQKNSALKLKKTISFETKEKWIKGNKALTDWFIVLSFCLSLILLYLLPKISLVIVFPLALLSVLYIIQISKIPALRSIPFLKIFIIAFVWGGVMVLLPILSAGESDRIFTLETQLLAIAIALFVFGETIPFDIRDLSEDRATKLKTIPLKIGLKKSKLLCLMLYVLSGALFISDIIIYSKPFIFASSFGFSLLLSYLIILRVDTLKKELYYSLLIESSLAFPIICYAFLSFLT